MIELTDLLNYSLVFGCSPGTGVKADTKMCKNVREALLNALNSDMFSVFPHFMESLKGDDANFEMNSSATLQPLRLYYSHHVPQEVLGYIFVFSRLKGFGGSRGRWVS